MGHKIRSGSFHPIGATAAPDGVNFALASRHAESVELCLFDRENAPPTEVIRLENRTRFIWHAFVEGVKPGQLYGYRVHGPYDPANGLRFNGHKLLIDPYAKALSAKIRDEENLLLAYNPLDPDRDLSFDTRDNAALVPKGVVIDDAFAWEDDAPPEIPLENLVIYEVHVKGFTAHPSSGVEHPGTFLGFMGRIPHLKRLGINAVEFLPVHEFFAEEFLLRKGVTNYWGYNTLGFFAPELSYGTRSTPGCQVAEWKTLVKALHRAGIEVILDVVYNHTCEGNECGPTLSLKGIDNSEYYMLTGPKDAPGRYYMNHTGCGNSVDLSTPSGLRLVMDSLRYWVEAMHVDGFRFDLASVLGREKNDFTTGSSFFDAVSQDPVLNRVKLIAEPWDIGTYQVGNFPVDWSEWNGKFRDSFRRFAKGDPGLAPEIGRRITGSADLYGDDGRSAYNSVNFITCHDGFTLNDLVSYNGKHNEANLEENRDGANDNNSWNGGVEGPTKDPGILALRRRMAKNHVCHLLFSSGTPMLLGGDEFLRTQGGNNNAYCQDNEISWFDWGLAGRNEGMIEFVRKAIDFTRRCSILQNRRFLTDAAGASPCAPIITWFSANREAPDWHDREARTLAYRLERKGADGCHERSLFFILNADWRNHEIQLPDPPSGLGWRRVLDTALPDGEDFATEGHETPLAPGDRYLATSRSTVVLIAK